MNAAPWALALAIVVMLRAAYWLNRRDVPEPLRALIRGLGVTASLLSGFILIALCASLR